MEDGRRLSHRRGNLVPGGSAGSSGLATRRPERPGAGHRQRGEPYEDRRTEESTADDAGGSEQEQDAALERDDERLDVPHRRVPGTSIPGSPVRARCSLRAASYSSSDLNSSASRSTFLVAVSQSRGSVLRIGSPRFRLYMANRMMAPITHRGPMMRAY